MAEPAAMTPPAAPGLRQRLREATTWAARDRWVRATLPLALALHLALAAAIHLSPDEAHYAMYASRLAWSYYDHPPLVGWVQWPAVALGGHEVLLRIVPLLCWVAAALGLAALTAELLPEGDPRLHHARRWLWTLWLLAPLPHLLGLALVPDTLMMPIVCAAMALAWRLAATPPQADPARWALLGACLGLAGLAKYTALLTGLGALAALSWAHGLRLWTGRGPWLALAAAAAVVSPVFAWNAAHDWASFRYQLGHAGGGGAWLAWRPAAYALGQVLAIGVLPWVGLWAAGRTAASDWAPPARGPRRALTPRALSACFGLPTLALCVYLSGRGTTLPHWTMPGWVALLPMAAIGCAAAATALRNALRGAAAFQLLCCLAMVALLLGAGFVRETGAAAHTAAGRHDGPRTANPVADLYGWDAAARRARELAAARGVTLLAVTNWTFASRIAWYARPLPVKVVQRHFDQFDLWFGPMSRGDTVLLVDWSHSKDALPVGEGRFVACEPLEQMPVMHLGGQVAHFGFLLCSDWQGPARP